MRGDGSFELLGHVRSCVFRRGPHGSSADVLFEPTEAEPSPGPRSVQLTGNAYVLNDDGKTVDSFNLQTGR